MRIIREDGTVSFPNGAAIGGSTTQRTFRLTPVFSDAQCKDNGTLPFVYFQFSGGKFRGKELLVLVYFYGELLVSISISADLYPEGNWDWSHYSLDVQAETKSFHDSLLESMLGPPTRKFMQPNQDEGVLSTLHQPLQWEFDWGSVHSGHDWNGGGTSIAISYGNRREETSKVYQGRS